MQPDGLFAVRLDHVFAVRFLQANHDVADDFERIFTLRIIARQNRQIAEPPATSPITGA